MPVGRRQGSLAKTASLFLAAAALTSPSLLRAQAPATPPGDPVRSPGNADWAPSVEEGQRRAAEQGKFLFVEFDSAGCRDCQRMDNLLYRAFDFEALLVPMVAVKVTMESAEGAELANHYGIKAAPSVLIRSPEGRMVVLAEGFSTPPDFYSNIRKELDTYRAFARKVEAQDVATLPPGEALGTGKELYQRGDPAAALPRFRRAASAPGGKPAQRDEARELLAAAELDAGDVKASKQTIQRLIDTTKDPEARERAELFRAQLPLVENNPLEADALYKKFEKDHPKSRYLPRVRAIRERIAAGIPKS